MVDIKVVISHNNNHTDTDSLSTLTMTVSMYWPHQWVSFSFWSFRENRLQWVSKKSVLTAVWYSAQEDRVRYRPYTIPMMKMFFKFQELGSLLATT